MQPRGTEIKGEIMFRFAPFFPIILGSGGLQKKQLMTGYSV